MWDLKDGKGQPRHDRDWKLGEYYWGMHCPHCSDMSPLIHELNDSIAGGRIQTIATDDTYSFSKMKHDSLSSKLTKGVKGSFKKGAIEATPTIIWSDSLKTQGAPYSEGGQLKLGETKEYLAIRTVKCYMKKANPGMPPEELDGFIDQVFTGRLAMDIEDGERVRDPMKAVREVTRRF